MRTVVITDVSVQFRLSRVTRSGKSSNDRVLIPLIVPERLVTCRWKVFCVDRPCSWCWKFLGISASKSGRYSTSKWFSNLAISGPESIHRRKAIDVSVSPTATPEPFTILFSSSWAWSNGIEENLLVVLESTQWECVSNSYLLVSGKDSISLMWTGIHREQLPWYICYTLLNYITSLQYVCTISWWYFPGPCEFTKITDIFWRFWRPSWNFVIIMGKACGNCNSKNQIQYARWPKNLYLNTNLVCLRLVWLEKSSILYIWRPSWILVFILKSPEG